MSPIVCTVCGAEFAPKRRGHMLCPGCFAQQRREAFVERVAAAVARLRVYATDHPDDREAQEIIEGLDRYVRYSREHRRQGSLL